MAAGVFSRHGYAVQVLLVAGVEFLWQSMSFIAEDQEIALLEFQLIDIAVGFSAAEEHSPGLGLLQEILPAIVYTAIQMRPIVQAGAAQMRLVKQEAKRSD